MRIATPIATRHAPGNECRHAKEVAAQLSRKPTPEVAAATAAKNAALAGRDHVSKKRARQQATGGSRCSRTFKELGKCVAARGMDREAQGTPCTDLWMRSVQCWAKVAGPPCQEK